MPATSVTDIRIAEIEVSRFMTKFIRFPEMVRKASMVEVTISRIIRQLGLSPDPARNPRVAVARAYFEMSGADAPDASRSA